MPLSLISALNVIKRNGSQAKFDPDCLIKAIKKAFCDVQGLQTIEELSEKDQALIYIMVSQIVQKFENENKSPIYVEAIQDEIEKTLMQENLYEVAKSFILYREEHSKMRKFKSDKGHFSKLKDHFQKCALGLSGVHWEVIEKELIKQLHYGIDLKSAKKALLLITTSLIEKEPEYDFAAARLVLAGIDEEVFGSVENGRKENHLHEFKNVIEKGVLSKRLDKRLLDFDLKKLSLALDPSRDQLFKFLGIKILYDRYLIHIDDRRIETPQFFFMRVAMGLSFNEKNKEEAAIEFYESLSKMEYVPSTPTLFNAGTLHPQLSSCYLSTVDDSLDHIFKVIGDNAALSKWAGGIGNDWSSVRASGARIHGTNGLTQGIIPFLKVVNDTALAVNQGGKRKGSICVYLELWHLDIEDFLELRKNTGDERRRTHDMNTANWIPDLFMKRVASNGIWTLFNPAEVPDLHELTGKAFEDGYQFYEKLAEEGHLKQYKQLSAFDLWRKMLTMLFETGHPWITFKDPSNIRSAQRQMGTIRSSNLCTEILLITSKEETAVCNLGSINLSKMIKNNEIDDELLQKTIFKAIRMLDNVIDINYYPTSEAKNSNLKHRPVGLGLMGFQELLFKLRMPYASEKAVSFSDELQEKIAFFAILASINLAKEKGKFPSYESSLWAQGKLPLDTLFELEQERGEPLQVDKSSKLNWDELKNELLKYGLRNCQLLAIAPTATIAQISGTTQSIEPLYSNLFVKSNLSGEFCAINPFLIEDLKARGLWTADMIDNLKYHDGSIQEIDNIGEDLKELYKTAFEIDSKWLIECASRRQKWIDMGQSLNLYANSADGKKLSDMYFNCWRKGLKTTYYLRSKSATQIEKSSIDINKRGFQPRWMKHESASNRVKTCELNGSCESCE